MVRQNHDNHFNQENHSKKLSVPVTKSKSMAGAKKKARGVPAWVRRALCDRKSKIT
jgi:ribosomal protein L39E